MLRSLTMLIVTIAEISRRGDARRSTTALPPAYRHMNMNINWTKENLEFQAIFDAYPPDHTFQNYIPTTLPTLKYQRGVNFTVYEMNIRKEQDKIQKHIDVQQAYVDQRRLKWMGLRSEIKGIRKNMTRIRKGLHNSTKHQEWLLRKKKLMKDLKALQTKYNVTDDRSSFEIAYGRAKLGLVRLIKKHTRFYMNKTKYFYEYILRKNELSDELYDLRDNITKLDMLMNDQMEKETIAPNVCMKDIMTNLSETIKSIDQKHYKYKKAKRGMQHLISIMNKFLNKSKMAEAEERGRLPVEILEAKEELRNLSARLKVADPRLQEMKKLLKDKSVEYHDVKYDFYRKFLKMRELYMEHFVWEMNLTNFLRERVRQDLVEMMTTPDVNHYLREQSSIDIKDNLFLDMIDQEKYWKNHLRYNKTTTAPYEWQEVVAFDEDCKKYMHDNWFSFEHLRHKFDGRKRRRRNVKYRRR